MVIYRMFLNSVELESILRCIHSERESRSRGSQFQCKVNGTAALCGELNPCGAI